MKKLLSLVPCFLLILTACATQIPAVNEPAPDNNKPIVAEEPQAKLIYTDPIYGFSLELPATWKGYVTKRKNFDVGGSAVYFGFTNWDDIFAISIAPVYEADPANAKYLGTDGKNYYYAGSSQYIKIADLEARRNEFAEIVKTFSLPQLKK